VLIHIVLRQSRLFGWALYDFLENGEETDSILSFKGDDITQDKDNFTTHTPTTKLDIG